MRDETQTQNETARPLPRIGRGGTDGSSAVSVLLVGALAMHPTATRCYPSRMPPGLIAALLLVASNTFMTTAWYGHLKYKSAPLWAAVLVSWAIAFFEYCLQVPANRIGSRTLSTYQLKIMQEAITLVVFIVFAWLVLGEKIQVKYLVSFGLMFAAVAVAFR